MNLSVPGWTRVHLIDLTRAWIDHAAFLGCPRLMVNHGNLTPEVMPMAIETMRIMADYGRTRGVMVTLENRSGVWEPIVEVVRAAGANTTLDLSAPDQETQLRMIRDMLPLSAGSTHVK